MSDVPTCYCCDSLATTREHAPPSVFFPELKDSQGADYRRNLITVPSCDEHNTSKSQADELVAYLIALSSASNEVGRNQAATKVLRTLKTRRAVARRLLFKHPLTLLNGDVVLATHSEKEAFDLVMTSTARALHFNRTGVKLRIELNAHSRLAWDANGPTPGGVKLHDHLASLSAQITWEVPDDCKNPQVFRYRYFEGDIVGYEFMFYEGFPVVIAPRGTA